MSRSAAADRSVVRGIQTSQPSLTIASRKVLDPEPALE